jgi:hypothetical protein
MKNETREAIGNSETWVRGLTYLLFFALLTVISPIAILVSLYGWLVLLWTGRTPDPVIKFGATLADWYRQAVRYITANGTRRPFPFEDLDCPRDEPDPPKARPPRPEAGPQPRAVAASGSSGSGPTGVANSAPEAGNANATPGASSKKAGKKAGKKKARKAAAKAGSKKAGKKAGKKASKKKARKTSGKSGTKKAVTKTEPEPQAQSQESKPDRDPDEQ